MTADPNRDDDLAGQPGVSRRGLLRAGLAMAGSAAALSGCLGADGLGTASPSDGPDSTASETASPHSTASPTDSPRPTASPTDSPRPTASPTPTDPYPDAFTIPYGSLAVDGDVSDLGEPTHDIGADFYPYEPDPPEESEGSVWVRWSETHLSLAASIVDDEWYTSADSDYRLYRNDCVELAIWPGDPCPDDYFDEVQFGKGTEGVQVHRLTVPDNRNHQLVQTAETAIDYDGERLTFELAFPWDAFSFDVDPAPGDQFGFGLGHHDADADGSGGWQEWGGAPFVPKAPEDMAEARLGPKR